MTTSLSLIALKYRRCPSDLGRITFRDPGSATWSSVSGDTTPSGPCAARPSAKRAMSFRSNGGRKRDSSIRCWTKGAALFHRYQLPRQDDMVPSKHEPNVVQTRDFPKVGVIRTSQEQRIDSLSV